ncbi:MAG: Crp/Fnr family transcriptional regulator [Clostridiales bacterium]|nr:Crp/Fnr family transcriptional regulator [Clostridiales bacterium]
MEQYFPILLKAGLFRGLNKEDIILFLTCNHYHVADYSKGETILHPGLPVTEFGLILTGEIEASQEDYSGSRVIVSHLRAPEMFAEVVASSSDNISMVTITALTQTKVLYLNYRRLSVYCSNGCLSHQIIIQNMLKILADKYFLINLRIGLLIKKNVRSKLALYLIKESEIKQSNSFPSAMNKTSLSFYLNVDRSAMSRELSRMRAEGLIDFNRRYYTLLQPDALKKLV